MRGDLVNTPRLLPLAAWWHRLRLHVVHHDITVPITNGHMRYHTFCLTCWQGWEYDR